MRAIAPWLAIVVFAAALGLSCSGRERTNPLDPGNPETNGRPVNFVALAGNARVDLRWNVIDVPELAGYVLERRAPGDPDFVELPASPLPSDEFTYLDSDVTNDSTYDYRLSFVLENGARSLAAVSTARPGPGALWVAEAGNDRLTKLAPDGRAVLLAVAAPDEPGYVRIDVTSGAVWTTSRTLGVVALWSAGGTLLGASSGFGAPGAVAPVPGTSSAWIAEERFGEVSRWSESGGVASRIDDFALPGDVVVTSDRGAWVADRVARALVRIASDATEQQRIELADRPWRLALDPLTGELWVTYAEAGAVERRAADGTLVRRIDGLDAPFGIALDFTRGLAWVTLADDDAAIAIDPGGAIVRRIGNIDEPRGIAIDGRLGEVWVSTLGEDEAAGQVLRYDSDGRLLSTYTGLVRPFAIDFDSGRGF